MATRGHRHQTAIYTYTVCHGGTLRGLGTWVSDLTSEAEARADLRDCRRIVGGEPYLVRSDGARLDEYGCWETPVERRDLAARYRLDRDGAL